MATTAEGEAGLSLDSVLSVEILAEAACNPRIAAILTAFDQDARAELAGFLAQAQGRGQVDPEADLRIMASLLLILMDGLIARAISDPSHDPGTLNLILLRLLRAGLAPDRPVEL